jgi:hypothetical protein
VNSDNPPVDWRSPQNNNLWQGVNGINNPCPSGYRLPTEAEWETERKSWISNNVIGAFASPLKLPLAGRRNDPNLPNVINNAGTNGFYWSSTVNDTNSRWLNINDKDDVTRIFSWYRTAAYSVRCIKN